MKKRPPRPRRTSATPGANVTVARRDGKRLPVRVVGGAASWSVTDPAHVLRTPPAFAKAESWLRAAEAAGAQSCEVRDLRDPTRPVTWRAPLRAWWGPYSVPIERAGWEPQRALLLSAPCWHLTGDRDRLADVYAGPATERPRPAQPEREARPVAVPVSLLPAEDLREPATVGRWW